MLFLRACAALWPLSVYVNVYLYVYVYVYIYQVSYPSMSQLCCYDIRECRSVVLCYAVLWIARVPICLFVGTCDVMWLCHFSLILRGVFIHGVVVLASLCSALLCQAR